MTMYNLGKIHILKGTGKNCSCRDCCVLYGGTCYTTPYNNFLDRIEIKINDFLSFTPKRKPRVVSDSFIDKSIEFIKEDVCKFFKVTSKQFYKNYYLFLPLIFVMTSDKKQASRFYRNVRLNLFLEIENVIKK